MDDRPCRCSQRPCGAPLPEHPGHCCIAEPDPFNPCHERPFVRVHLAVCSVPHTRLRRMSL